MKKELFHYFRDASLVTLVIGLGVMLWYREKELQLDLVIDKYILAYFHFFLILAFGYTLFSWSYSFLSKKGFRFLPILTGLHLGVWTVSGLLVLLSLWQYSLENYFNILGYLLLAAFGLFLSNLIVGFTRKM